MLLQKLSYRRIPSPKIPFLRLPVELKAKIWFFVYPAIKQKQDMYAVSAPGIFVKIALKQFSGSSYFHTYLYYVYVGFMST